VGGNDTVVHVWTPGLFNGYTVSWSNSLVHSLDELVDLVLSVTSVSSLDVMVSQSGPSSRGGAQLEGPQKFVGLCEVGSNSEDLVDKILNTDDVVSSESLLDQGVLSQRKSLSLELGISSLVDEGSDGGQVGVSVGNVGLNQSEHLSGGSSQSDEGSVVDLSQSEELQDLSGLGVESLGSLDSDDESELGLLGEVKVSSQSSLSLVSDKGLLLDSVLSNVLLGSSEDVVSNSSSSLDSRELSLVVGSGLLSNGLRLLDQSLGDWLGSGGRLLSG